MRRRTVLVLGSPVLVPASILLADCTWQSTTAPTAIDAGALTAVLSTAPVDFGVVDCGAAASPRTYSIVNTSASAITYAATVSGAPFSVQGTSSGSVEPGGIGTISLAAGPVPTSSVAGLALTGALTLTTNAPGYGTVQVPLVVTPHGASLHLSPSVAGFGSTQVGVAATAIPITVTNSGNAAATVTLSAPTDRQFSLTSSAATTTIAAGDTVTIAQAGFIPTSPAAASDTLAVSTTDAICGAPNTVSLTGTGTTAPVSIGPSPIDFGAVDCGATAKAASVTITSGYSLSIAYTATLGLGGASPFVLGASSGSISDMGTATVSVTPKAVPSTGDVTAGAYDDTLTITTTAPGSLPVTIPLEESAQGAILTVSAPSNLGATSGPTSLPFSVTNSGNVAAPLTIATSGAGFSATPASATASTGTPATGNVTFTPAAAGGAASGTFTVTTTAPLCGPAPATSALSAFGDLALADIVVPTAFDVTCTLGASPTQSVSVTNGGSIPLTLSGVGTTTGRVQVVSAPQSIAPGASGSIVLQAKAAAIGTDMGGTTNTDSLVFTTNESSSPQHAIPLSIRVHGANLSFTPSSTIQLVTNCSGGVRASTYAPYGIQNTGDEAALVIGPGTLAGDNQSAQTAKFCGADTTECLTPFFASLPGSDSVFWNDGDGVTLGAGATVTDAIGAFDEYCPEIAGGICDVCSGTDTFTFEVSGDVCIGLPSLTYDFNYGGGQTVECFCS